MSTLLWLLVLLGVLLALASMRANRLLATAVVATTLILISATDGMPDILQGLLWLLFLGVAIPLNVTQLRQRWITRPVLRLYRDMLPPMSATEQQAIDAGSVWWDGELFSGRPDWQRLLAMPGPSLTEEERAFLDGPTEQLCAMLDDWRITHEDQDLPEAAWAYIREQGFLGLIIPKDYGGKGFSAFAHSEIIMKLASRSVTAAVSVMVPNSLGPGELLLHYGTKAQKEHYLPRLARGDEMPCFALTGPEVGSDAGRLPDTGVVCRQEVDGEQVLGVRLNFSKRYITLAPIATVIGLAFRMSDPERLLGGEEDLGITVALVPAGTPGVRQGERHLPLNVPFQNGPLYGEDVFAPLDWIIGEREGIGRGWQMLVECLAHGRAISLPAQATGSSKLACRGTGAYARIREQFRTPIGHFEGVEEVLARMAGRTYQMDAVRRLTLYALDQGEKPSVVSAIVKYHLTENMRGVITDAMDVQGGSGIMLGPRNLLGRLYQGIPISITVEGANILTRSMIIFGQGAVRAHPYVLQEMAAVAEPDEGRALERFDHVFFGHVGYALSNAARSFLHGLTRGYFAQVPGDGELRRSVQRLNWLSAAFALAADVSMLSLGGELKRRERISARLGDVLSHLYLASGVLNQFEVQGRLRKDLPLAQWALEDSLYRAQQALEGLLENFSLRPAAWLLRVLIFPTGRMVSPPSDRLGHKAAGVLLRPSETRDRLTAGIWLTASAQEPLGRLDRALELAEPAERLHKRLRQAVKSGELQVPPDGDPAQAALAADLITDDDAALLDEYETLRREIIAVDAFAAAGRPGAQDRLQQVANPGDQMTA